MTTINTSSLTPQISYAKKNGNSSAPAAPTPFDSVTLSQKPADTPVKEWTMMLYFASDNNLYPWEVRNLRNAEKVGTTDQMNVVAQMSYAHKPSINNGNVIRYEVQKCKPGETSPIKEDLGKQDTSSAQTLSDFIKWSKTNYPAKHYMLVVNDHGNGWEGCLADETHQSWFDLPKLEGALKTAREGTDGKPLDVLGFDCCLMANIENAAQMHKEASFMVHSEETEGGSGWTYNQIINDKVLGGVDTALRSRDGLSPKELAIKVVSMAKAHDDDLPTMSALDTSKVPALLDATKAFGQAIKATSVPNVDIASAADKAQHFYMESDLWDFANNVAAIAGAKDKNLTATAEAVKTAVENALVAESHSPKYPNAHGMTVELKAQAPGVAPASINPAPELRHVKFGEYKDLRFQQDSDFNGAVTKFRGAAPAVVS